jgi:hypothetical protein
MLEIELRSQDQVSSMSMWTPPQFMVDFRQAQCLSIAHKALKAVGIKRLEDIMEGDGQPISWDDQPFRMPQGARQAYKKLCKSLNREAITQNEDKCMEFVTTYPY